MLKLYKIFISPLLGHNCRFMPTCSEYADEAIKKHGILKGGWLALKRISKCNPFFGKGYVVDNVPEKE